MVNFGLANISDIAKINERVGENSLLTPDTLLLCGKQGDEIIMWFAFRIDDDKIEILDIYADNNDEKLLFFCGKSGLNTLDLTGYRNIISKNEKINDVLYKLGFKKEEDEDKVFYLVITDDYFKAGCCEHF